MKISYGWTFDGVFQQTDDHILSFDHELGHRSNGVNVQWIVLSGVEMLDENRENLIDQRWFDSIESNRGIYVVVRSSVRLSSYRKISTRYPHAFS